MCIRDRYHRYSTFGNLGPLTRRIVLCSCKNLSKLDTENNLTTSAELLASFDPLLKPGQVVLIGEWHGTNEFPDLVGHLATRCCRLGHSVTIAIEVACSEQRPITEFVAADSPGTEFLDGPWWHRSEEFQDGRSSQAVARLIHTAARLKGEGNDVFVAAVDGPWVAPGSPVDPLSLHLVEIPRDQVMAKFLLETMDERPRATTFFLGGHDHARVTPLIGNAQPAGRYVHMWHPKAISLLGRFSEGTAWTLDSQRKQGGIRAVTGDASLNAEAIWSPKPGEDGHHGYVHVGTVSASEPFVGGTQLV